MAGTNPGFSREDLRIVIGLCELDHKVTDLIGPRMELSEMIQHRYRVSTVAAKANILLQALVNEHIAEVRAGTASVGDPDPAQ